MNIEEFIETYAPGTVFTAAGHSPCTYVEADTYLGLPAVRGTYDAGYGGLYDQCLFDEGFEIIDPIYNEGYGPDEETGEEKLLRMVLDAASDLGPGSEVYVKITVGAVSLETNVVVAEGSND